VSGTPFLLGLARACHAGPSFVVTAAVTAVAASLGRTGLGVIAVAIAVLLGQLSVGWSNDAIDWADDAAAGRTNKPIVAGQVGARTLRIAASSAALLCIPMSFVAAGRIGGLAHIVAVASAWIYNLWLKSTAFSVLPYVLSFGLIAPFLTYGLSPQQPPATWFVLTLACLGLAAGMANSIPDIEGDQAVDRGGLVARLGARTSSVVAAIAVVVATVLLATHVGLAAWIAVALIVGATLIAIVGAVVARGRYLFTIVMILALTDTVLLCLAGASAVVR